MKVVSHALAPVLVAWVLAGTANAVVIGDFEGGLDGFSNIGTAGLSVDASTATLGASSLRVADTGTGWSQSIKADLAAVWATEIAPGGTLTLDIKAAGGAPDVPAWWLQVIPVINSQNGGWQQLASVAPVLDNQWHSHSWTYPAMAAVPGDWAEIFLISNSSDIRNYNLDNVAVVGLVPEPASFLAVFGLVTLTRRRRT